MATMGNMTATASLPEDGGGPAARLCAIHKVVDVHFVFLANPALAANRSAS